MVEKRVPPERPELQDRLVGQAGLGVSVQLGPLELLVPRDPLVVQVARAGWGLLELRGQPEERVAQEALEGLAVLGLLGLLEQPVPLERQALRELPESARLELREVLAARGVLAVPEEQAVPEA